MPELKEFHLKWQRRATLRNPDDWKNIPTPPPRWAYNFSHRLVAFSVLYYNPSEYIDPIVDFPVPRVVVDVTQRECLASKNWRPLRRLEVDRHLFLATNPTDRWSPIHRYNTLVNHHATYYQQINYDFHDHDRSIWFPDYVAFLLATPLMLYLPPSEPGSSRYTLSYRTSYRIDTPPSEITWRYPHLEGPPPPTLDVSNLIVKFNTRAPAPRQS